MGKKSLGGKETTAWSQESQQRACWTSLLADRPRQSLDHSHQAGIPGRICNRRGSKLEFAAQNVERNRRRASLSTVIDAYDGRPPLDGGQPWGCEPPFSRRACMLTTKTKTSFGACCSSPDQSPSSELSTGCRQRGSIHYDLDDQRILLNALKEPRYPDRYSGRGLGFANVSDLRRDEWERADSYPRDGSEGFWHCHTDLLSRCVLYRCQPVQGKLHGHCRDMVVAVRSSGKKVSPCMSFTARRPGEVTAAQFGLVAPSTGRSVVPGVLCGLQCWPSSFMSLT